MMASYGDGTHSRSDLHRRAAPSKLGGVTIEAVPGYGYVFSAKKSDGVHYGALRVAYVAQSYVVFDWSYQSAMGNIELSRVPSQ